MSIFLGTMFDTTRTYIDPVTGNLIIGAPTLVGSYPLGIFPITNPPPFTVRSITNANDDPELQHKIVKYYFERIRDIYLPSTFSKLLKYVAVRDGKPQLVASQQEYENNNTTHNLDIRVKYVLDNFFSKYDLEVVIGKVVSEFGLNWYDLKNKHSSVVKKAIYRKIKHRLEKNLRF